MRAASAALAAACCMALASRPTAAVPTGPRCNNTGGGEYLIADSTGFVCPRTAVNLATGCCDAALTGTKKQHTAFSCATCDVGAACCTSYEHCVSCCLKPGNPGSDAALVASAPRARGRPESGHWPSPFAFCAGVCRTTHESTAHENAYISPAHFCFSTAGVPRYPEPDPEPPALGEGVVVVAAEAGSTCSAACEAAPGGPLTCAQPESAAALSDCNALRSHFPCEAGCLPADDGATPAPAYVLPAAAKALRPAACLTLAVEADEEEEEEEGGGGGGGGGAAKTPLKGPPPPPDCDAAVADMRRLCACVKGAAA